MTGEGAVRFYNEWLIAGQMVCRESSGEQVGAGSVQRKPGRFQHREQ